MPKPAPTSTPDRPKHAGGRPTSYRPYHGDQMITAMAKGLSAEAAAASIGISNRALHEWQKKHGEFRSAIQEGRQRALLWWEQRALAVASGAPGRALLISLGLRNRSRAASGWVDISKLEHSGLNGTPIQAQQVTTVDVSTLTAGQQHALRAAMISVKSTMSE